ncbi:hypothetical protein [Mucilaginibacter glaciei]|uniref:Uncharacterized protein n=1 Tax=Mucilaginibacter glaciei TaxID=2772109 RepID=A0A926NV17_9SPHI|nr:hypothetical protein [Mucilaginibacter glaciei]MBD1392239.1 hypothetical protein [Mucilaginibacter glaciei]
MSKLLKKIPAAALSLVTLLLIQCATEPSSPKELALNQPVVVKRSSGGLVYPANNIPLKNMFGVNSYEWNFLENPATPNEHSSIYEDNMALIKSFGAVRHYMNWNKLENTQGNYTYNPTNNGSWNYDLIYTRCQQEGILVLADLKNLPVWMMNTYPADERDDENVPAPYGSDRTKPNSYIAQARTAFQFAARYGYNKAVDPALVKVDSRPRWNNDKPNTVKIGMSLIRYIECGNENDRWWKGDKATQTPEEYAANLSAFYDGHKGALGRDAGVKTADPAMQVVMGGLATADTNYVQRMINWCKINRGYKADGKVNLCFDVINYHLYSNNGSILTHKKASTGMAPEFSEAAGIADSFIKVANGIPVWVTETGYDVNPESYQHAPSILHKSPLLVQGDWIIRSSLLYIRHGIQRLFFYQLFDAFPGKGEQYATSGLAEGIKRRPAADYIMQTNKLMGSYLYKGTINGNPLVDKFQSGKKTIYVLTVPDSQGRTAAYFLDLGNAKSAIIHMLKVGSDTMESKIVVTKKGKLPVIVTETPVFIEAGL